METQPGLKRVYLVPFMIVAGDHAKHDMAGDEPDSWKSLVAQAGYEPRCICRGLGELEAVWELLEDHGPAGRGPAGRSTTGEAHRRGRWPGRSGAFDAEGPEADSGV